MYYVSSPRYLDKNLAILSWVDEPLSVASMSNAQPKFDMLALQENI